MKFGDVKDRYFCEMQEVCLEKMQELPETKRPEPLMVQSVEKAFRVLTAFDEHNTTLSLTQLARIVDLDKSATQRFAYTLERLGYLKKDPATKRFELTVRTLDVGYHFARANVLIRRAFPYLQHLGRETEETVNLQVLDDLETVFVSRITSRHVLNNDVIVGMRMPAFSTAAGRAIMAAMPEDDARGILERSDRRSYTPATTTEIADLEAEFKKATERGYATAFDQYYLGDLSIACAILDGRRQPIGAVNVAVSRARFSPEEVEAQFAPLVVAAARSISQANQ